VSALSDALGKAKAEGRAALIGYLPVGYPTVDASIEAMRAMVAGGVDIVEVGVPYSDPVMDGPTIQTATEQAVRAGVTLRDALTAVRAVVDAGAAAVTMGYWNQIDRYGVERFATDLAAAGGSGAVTPDLIPDEAAEWIAASDAAGLDRIFLVAPSSTDARIVSTAVSGLSPEIMGLGPIEASKKALERAGKTIDDIDLVEINEAFAAQVIPSARELGIDPFGDKLNVNGGAIAVGHPFGMTGARITTTLVNSLQYHDKTFGLETMCVGGGQGMAMVLERLS